MIKVKRLGHVTLSTPDVARQIDYWTQVMGLQVVDKAPTSAVLATRLGQEVIKLEAGDHAGLASIAFQVTPGSDLKALAEYLDRQGIVNQRISDMTPGVSDALNFADPKGTTVQIYADTRWHSRSKAEGGVDPLKLGHVAYRVKDVQKITKFYQDVLGFRVSDWMGDNFVFMRCGPDHHTVNFAQYDEERLHHIAFEVQDWSAVQRSCEAVVRNGLQLVWGPLRHVVGHNVAAYHRNSDDLRIECYCELDRMLDEKLGYWEPRPWHEETPLYPRKWPNDTLRSAWGFGSFGTFPGYP